MEEMLRETERYQGQRTDLLARGKEVEKPTIEELGITWRESAEAQRIPPLKPATQRAILRYFQRSRTGEG